MTLGFGFRRRCIRGRRPVSRPSIVPRLQLLEDRTVPSVRMVANVQDSGRGSLRAVIAAARAGDTIRLSSKLAGHTITLKSALTINKPLTIEGPGASGLTVSGNDATQVFDIRPSASSVTIANLAVTHGLSGIGGGILDDGASLTLTSVKFSDNTADTMSPGDNAVGGALAVLGESGTGMKVTITNCTFANNAARGSTGAFQITTGSIDGSWAKGGAIYLDAQTSAGLALAVKGTTFTNDSAKGGNGLDSTAGFTIKPTNGGSGQGGAVWLWADVASAPTFTFTADAFSRCSAVGGRGGDGATGADGTGFDGGWGGSGQGGAIFEDGGLSAAPSLNALNCSFVSDTAGGGRDGNGGAGDPNLTTNAGNGGFGGGAAGGAVMVTFWNSVSAVQAFSADTFGTGSGDGGSPPSNKAVGGDGGDGGDGFSAGYGGNAGDGLGGNLEFGGFGPNSLVFILQSTIIYGLAQGGDGGVGGSGFGANNGGTAGEGLGGGLGLFGEPPLNAATWVLDSDIISYNVAASGSGGNGGNGFLGGGGNGGDTALAAGGGIADWFGGTLQIFHSIIAHNSAAGGQTGTGAGTGSNGVYQSSTGGGISIPTGITALATTDTQYDTASNAADINPNIDGSYGTI